MNPASFSVKRPVFTTMVTLIVVVLGLVALRQLRVDLLPEVELPRLTIRTSYEGASPEVMEQLVSQTIEQIVSIVPGVEEITSVSAEGNSTVRVTFGWGVDIDIAAQDVTSTLENSANDLPDNASRPRVSKFDIARFPVVLLGISSHLDPVELTELIDNQIFNRFSSLPGVAQADLWGGYQREVRIALDAERVKALGLPLNNVLAAIRNANLDLPAGRIEQGQYDVILRAPAQFRTVEEIGETVVAVREGAPIALNQIADVEDTHQRLTRIIRVNGERGLRMAIRKQADANTVEVATAVFREIERVNAEFPQINIIPVIDQGDFIERSIRNVSRSVLYGGVLAVIILLFFLRSLRSTLVISVAIPISIIGAFALIYFCGFTLNLMTLGGLALGVGMMVDSSIVVLENIFRRRSEHQDDLPSASINGAMEVSGALIASTITTLVIFLPVIFMQGVAAMLFSELALVIVFSLVCALAVSLSLVPMLASRLLGASAAFAAASPTADAPTQALGSGLGDMALRAFKRLESGYCQILETVLRRRALTVAGAVILLGVSLTLAPMIGAEFLPPSDEGEVRVTGAMELGVRLDLVDQQSRQVEAIVDQVVPDRVASVASIGASGWRPDSASETEIRISLPPAGQREKSNTEIAAELRRELDGRIAGMSIRTRAPQGQFILERLLGSDDGLTLEIRGYDLVLMGQLAEQAASLAREVAGVTDVEVGQQAGVPQAMIRIDRAKAADLRLSVRDISEAIETAIAGSPAGDYTTQGNAYRILVQIKDAQQLSIDEVLDLTLRNELGEDVALRNVVTSELGRGPVLIDRKDQQRIVTVSVNIAGRDSGSVAREIERRLMEIPKPSGYEVAVAGSYEEQQKAFNELLISFGLALVLVYMVLACQYESLRDPLVVMLSVPMAAIGVLLTLFLTDTTLNIQSYIGCIMLGGIVVNNAILLVDQAGYLRRDESRTTHEAIVEAGRRRLRPILMTTITTILGLTPLALGVGEGADAQAPLARAVIGGLTASTLITLLLIPAVYSLFHPDRPAKVAA